MRLDIKDLVDKKFQNKNQFAKAIESGILRHVNFTMEIQAK